MSNQPTRAEGQRVTCPVCGDSIPPGAFCAACGASLLHEGPASARRTHSYAASPSEHVLHLSVVSSLFPHLSHRARGPFRIGFAFLVIAMLALAAGHLQAPVIAVSALGIPLLFQLYLYEIDIYEAEPVLAALVTLGIGGALGAGWSLLTDQFVTNSLRLNQLGGPAAGTGVGHAIASVFVPVGAQVLMIVPVAIMRLRQRQRPDSLDGFVFGAAGALGFVVVATFVQLAPQLRQGVVVHGSIVSILAEAVIHGICVPLVAACATGLIGATIWVRRREVAAHPGRWLSRATSAIGLALLLQAGLGYTDVSAPGTGVVVTAHVAVALIYLVVLRIGLHHVLLHEAHDVQIGGPRVCHHCHHIVPAAPFCAHCGAAERATTPAARRRLEVAPQAADGGQS